MNGSARGVAFLLSKRVLSMAVEFREVSEELMWVKAKFGGEDWVERSEYEREVIECIISMCY